MRTFFTHINIATRLILVFSVIGVGVTVISTSVSYNTAKNLMEQETYNKLIAVRDIKKRQIEAFIQEKERDILVIAQGRDIHELFEQLVQYHIRTNVGPQDSYDVSTPEYISIYKKYGKIFDYYINMYGYRDIYLLCTAHGHVMYTTAKQADLGTNLQTGPYRDTHLATLWKKVVDTRQVALEDFQPYRPDNNRPNSFLGTPIFSEAGELSGIVVLQLPVAEVNSIMQVREGLGETGETYLVGSDLLMRSDSYLDPEKHSVVTSFANPVTGKVDTEAAREALSGNTGVRLQKDYRGITVLSAYTPVEIHDIRWAVLAEIDATDAFGPVKALRNSAIFSGGVLICLVAVGAFFLARGITRPLKQVAAVAGEISKGNLNLTVEARSRDEIGQVLRAMKNMAAYIRNVAQIAESVANNELDIEVHPQSEYDVLNHSLVKMIDNLREMRGNIEQSMDEIEQQYNAIKEQNWTKDGLSQLSAALSGDHTLAEIGSKAASMVARYVDAGQGVLYTYDGENEMLSLQGTFAFTERDSLSNQYQVGEGVIGQVALEHKSILLKHPDSEKRVIRTGTVNGTPLNTYTFPLLYNNTLYGVFELASFETFDERKQHFLQQANQVIAAALFSAIQRERNQELLQRAQQAAREAEDAKEEAQQQAEETRRANILMEEQQQQLQQQNEEFQQLNAQLEEQHHQLEQQREELRQQREALEHRTRELDMSKKRLE